LYFISIDNKEAYAVLCLCFYEHNSKIFRWIWKKFSVSIDIGPT